MSEENKSLLPFKIKSSKKLKLILIIALCLILIFILFGNFNTNSSKPNQEDDVTNYIKNLESKLEKTLSCVSGVGKVSVVIAVESGMENVLATKTTSSGSGSNTEIVETPITVNGKPVVIKELYPKITGVLIVAKGADNIFVMKKIQQATVSLFDININQIEILAMK